MQPNDKPKIGLWKKEDKNGNAYWSGSDEKSSYKIFPNKYKTKPNQPDYQMYIDGKKADGAPTTGFAAGFANKTAVQSSAQQADELPF